MKRLAFAIGILALGVSASTAARADYAVVMFKDGYCRVWQNSGATPTQPGWKLSLGWSAELGLRDDQKALRHQARLVQRIQVGNETFWSCLPLRRTAEGC